MTKIFSKAYYKGAPGLPQKGENLIKTFNDFEIARRAKADPDAQPLTDQELSKFRRVISHRSSK